MRVLNIIESAYRATIEEQDDTIVWLTHTLKGAGADLDVLLRGNAANYAALGQNAAGLAFGDWKQTQPPWIGDDVSSLVAKGFAVYAIAEDLADRGLGPGDIINGIERVARASLPQLMAGYGQIWHW
jgi:hypothetical protein